MSVVVIASSNSVNEIATNTQPSAPQSASIQALQLPAPMFFPFLFPFPSVWK